MIRYTFNSPVGKLTIKADNEYLYELSFGEGGTDAPNEIIKRAIAELCEYFEGRRRSFDLPLRPQGTEFQKTVWAALCEIPCGETRSYADIAEAIGKPNAARAVGMANNKNPIAIIIPCHRVIGKNGSLTGYAAGLEIKDILLKLESKK